ncbi:MAG TPA: type II toxin-antitoxin system Phd/YefM family antitoxin [Oculatellaceae cyanobacterium]|jgi:prevent-host-death family protein
MNTIAASIARKLFPDLLNRVGFGHERILVERRGKPIAAIVSIEDLQRLEALEDLIDSAALRKAKEENTGFTTLEAITEAREE